MITELTTDTLSHERLCQINGEDYNPRDNRTFKDKPLSMSPYRDILIRIGLEKISKQGARSSCAENTCYGTILLPSMAKDIGVNNVLQFPQVSDFENSVKIKTVKVSTLLPPSLIRRYQREEAPFYRQSVPIYFNTKSEMFFSPLDKRFPIELASSEFGVVLSDKIKRTGLSRKSVQFYLEAKTLKELVDLLKSVSKDTDHIRHYMNYFVNFNKAERVIILHFDRTLNDGDIDKALFRGEEHNQLIEKQSAKWSYFQAVKVDNTLYLMDEEGNIDKKNTLAYDPELFVSSLEPVDNSLGFRLLADKRNVASLIMPYSQDSWNIVTGLHARLNALFDEIQHVLLSAKQGPDMLDKPLSDVRLDYALTDKCKGS